MDLRGVIRGIPDFPKPGILFCDITPVLASPEAFKAALTGMGELVAEVPYNQIAGIESRGFLFGAPLAQERMLPMILMRKAGKLPAKTCSVTYALEYGEATLEAHEDSCGPGDRVLIIDDLLATGGTAAAAGELIGRMGATVAGFLFLVELDGLAGREKLTDLGPVFSLVKYP